MRLFLVLLLVLSALPVHGREDEHKPIQFEEPVDDNLRILQVKLAQYELDEVLTAYQYSNGVYIPLGLFSQIVGLAIQVDSDRGVAEGFIINEDRYFYLDSTRDEISVAGNSVKLEKNSIKLFRDDIYVHEDVLRKYFPLDLTIELYSSYIYIKPKEPFPLQQRKEREQKLGKIKPRSLLRESNYPEYVAEYKQYDYPFVDQTVGLVMNQAADGTSSANLNYTTYMTSDLFGLEGAAFLSGNTDDLLQNFRLTFSEHDPDAELLGFAHAREYSFGHVNLYGTSLVTTNHAFLPGVTVSNYLSTQQINYDSHTFGGDLLPGWEVELYQNSVLIGYQSVPDNGQYLFENVPLLFGSNYFRLVFYGPHGETREETHNFVLNNSLVRAGEYNYRVGVAGSETGGSSRVQMQYVYGVNKYLTSQFNLVSAPVLGLQHDYLTVGFSGFTESLFAKLDFITDTAGGSATDLSLQSRLLGLNLLLSLSGFDRFTSEIYQPDTTARTGLRIDGAIPQSFMPRLPVSLEYIKQDYQSGNYRTDLIGRVSASGRGYAVSNEVKMTEFSDANPDTNTGSLQLSTHHYNYGVRGELYYDLTPDFKLTSIAVTYIGKNLGPYYVDFGISLFDDPTYGDIYQYLVGLHKTKGEYGLDVNLSYKTNGEISLISSMAMSFGRDRRKNDWFTSYSPMAGKGAASFDVFVDKNGNNLHDVDEVGIENVVVAVNGVRKLEKTDADGVVLLTELSVYQHTDFSIAEETLVDPLWMPKVTGINSVLRPGSMLVYNFPVQETGEVDGTVYLRDKTGKSKPLGDVVLEVVDADGKVVSHAKSAYDGFYVLSKIPVGQYHVRVADEQKKKYDIKAQDKLVSLAGENMFINGVDVIIEKQ